MAQRAKEKGIEIKNPNVIENKNQIKKKKNRGENKYGYKRRVGSVSYTFHEGL